MLTVLFLLLAGSDVTALVRDVSVSGQVVELAVTPSDRVSPPAAISPGAPPLLSFRLMEGRLRHRFGDLDLVLDDAGH